MHFPVSNPHEDFLHQHHMPRYFAFLRAINVGGHTVKMERLRALFESLELSGVETLIASGNVIFRSRSNDATALERSIEAHLRQALGYAVSTFIRSDAELTRISSHTPFAASELNAPGNGLYIGFVGAKPAAPGRARLMSLCGSEDDFRVHQREIYWLRRGKFSDSRFSGALLEKTLGMPATFRNATTLRRLAAKYPEMAPA